MTPKIVQRKVSSLVPYARNSRTHSERQVEQIAASITEFGWTNPVLVGADNVLIAGHGRVLAAQLLGIDKVPAIVLDHLTEQQQRALVIADNKLALNAGWDAQMLKAELADLQDSDFDLSLTGFSADELSDMAIGGTIGLTDPDAAPALDKEVVSVLGDVWILGNHRIVCGDCTDADTVGKALDGSTPHLMVTDPPYGVNYKPQWRIDAGLAGAGGNTATGVVLNDDRADWSEAWALFPGSVAYVWHAGLFADVVSQSLAKNGLLVRSQIVWVKTRLVLGRGDYHPQHEPALYAVRDSADDRWQEDHEVATYVVQKGKPGQYRGGRKQSTVWMIEHLKSDTGHGTQKPVECMRRPIVNNSKVGDLVYEPFSGSGTTIIAGEMTGRHVRALELSPAYVDVAVRRWQEFTGLQARHEDGRLFDDIPARKEAA